MNAQNSSKLKKKKKTHTIIISDLHLGSSVSEPAKALETLKRYSFEKLILLGDVFDSLDFRDLDRECWDLLTYIGEFSKKKRVRWIVGNHDAGLTDVFDSLMDARTYETYSWKYNDKKYLAIHGHQYDRFLVNNAFLSYVATKIYNFVQKIDSEERKFSRFLKRQSKGWLRLTDKVARAALALAEKEGADYVFCGHTHKALERRKHRIRYYNSGCWTDIPCTYITINENKIQIHEY